MNRFTITLLFCGSLLAADSAHKGKAAINIPVIKSAHADLLRASEVAPKSLVLRLGDRDIGLVHVKKRFDTWIILPPDEAVTAAGSGDNDNWQIRPADDKRATNLFHVQPSTENTRTNLNLRSSAGHYYSLLLIEDSACTSCQPDLKVFIEPIGYKIPTEATALKEDSEKQISTLKAQLSEADTEGKRSRADAALDVERKIAAFRAEYPLTLKCSYRARYGKAPFNLDAICTDGVFTYIKSEAAEMPSLYVEKDGKPALVQFKYIRGENAHDGTYVVDSVMRNGYLQLGKKKLKFSARG